MPPKPMEDVAVIGAGNGGHAMAAHLVLLGVRVRFYEMPQFAANIRPAREQGGIQISGVVGEGFARPALITTDIPGAIQGASHVLVATQALAHEAVAGLCAPHLEEGQTMVLFPGSGGSLQVAKTLRDLCVTRKVYLAETVTLPYACRLRGPAYVHVHDRVGSELTVAALPARETNAVIETLLPVYPGLTPATHVLETALCNPNIVLHPIGVLFNLGRIEHAQGEFWMYREGFTPSVMLILEALAAERAAVLHALGVRLEPCRAYYEWRYEKSWSEFAAVSSKGPASARTRYLSEDIPIGMVLLASLGERLDVPTPTARALIHLSSVIHDTDYWQGGRTVEKLGLAGMSVDALTRYLLEGSAPAA